MLKLLREKDQLGLVLWRKNVIVRLECLVELVQAGHFTNQFLRRCEMSLLGRVLLESALVDIELTTAGIAPILYELEQWIQVIDLTENFLRSCDPELAQAIDCVWTGRGAHWTWYFHGDRGWFHCRALAIEWGAWRVSGCLLERSGTIGSTWPLEA